MIEAAAGADWGLGARPAAALAALFAFVAAAEVPAPPVVVPMSDGGAAPGPVRTPGVAETAGLGGRAGLAAARAAVQRGAELLAAGQAAQAAAVLDAAVAMLRADRAASVEPAELAAGEALRDRAQAAARADAEAAIQASRRAAILAAHGRTADDLAGERSRLAEGLARVRGLRQRGHLELALADSRRLAAANPGEPEVEELFRSLLADVHEQRRVATAAHARLLREEVLQRAEMNLLPARCDGMPDFPEDWERRSAGRGAAVLGAAMADPAWREALRDSLAKRISVEFEQVPGPEALQALAKLGGINVVASNQVLTGPETPVTLRASGIRLDSAISWVCRQIGQPWMLANGAVQVGGEAEKQPLTAAHDVTSLISPIRDQAGRSLALNAGGGKAGGGGADLFAGAAAGAEEEAKTLTPEDLADMVKKAVAPAIWQEDGAGYGVAVHGGTLLVTAPPEVHRQVEEFLRVQSGLRNLQVRMLLRWVSLVDRLAEEVGVAWTDAQGQGAQLSYPAGSPARGWGWNRGIPQGFASGSLINQLPGTASNLGSPGAGLTLTSMLVQPQQLMAVLTAVERNQQGHLVSATDLVTINGTRSNCFFGNQLAYIADYDVVDTNLDPTIEILTVGTQMDIRPQVSADRKYVTVDLQGVTTSVTMFTDFIQAQRYGGNNAIGNLNGPTVNGGTNAILGTFAYPIEMPNVQIREFQTRAMLPDRGSLLVGGFGAVLEQDAATGIPLLRHIPFLGRLFGQRGRYSDRSQLYLVATATIIDYDDLEARL